MDDEDIAIGCVSQSQCRLCQFRFQQDEAIVAYSGDDFITDEFKFQVGKWRYELEHIALHFCGGSCNSRVVACFHAKCYCSSIRLVPKLLITPQLLATTLHSFQPLACDEHRRIRHAQELIFRGLQESQLCPALNEVRLIIAELLAEDLARQSAVIALGQIGSYNASNEIRLSSSVYALYKIIEGVRYIQRLQNFEPCEKKSLLWQLLYNISDPQRDKEKDALCKIVVMEDHVGIRQLRFVRSHKLGLEEPPPIQDGVWWSDITVPDGTATLTAITDGSKLRDLAPAFHPEPSVRVYWAAALHPSVVIDLVTLRPASAAPARMYYFPCNAQRTRGYSVATNGLGLSMIHAHQDNNCAGIYKDVRSIGLVWIYMPIDDGEYLVEVCRSYGVYRNIGYLTVLFLTNRGRCVHFGYCPPPTARLVRVYTPPKTTTHVFFNLWDFDGGIRYLAVEKSERPTERPWPAGLQSEAPPHAQNEAFFFSSCKMDGITEITICMDTSGPFPSIIGMLLQSRKTSASVGQFRFDLSLNTIQVGPDSGFYIGTRKRPNGYAYVAYVTLSCPSSHDPRVQWNYVGLCGVLEWWFTSQRCVVRYFEDAGKGVET